MEGFVLCWDDMRIMGAHFEWFCYWTCMICCKLETRFGHWDIPFYTNIVLNRLIWYFKWKEEKDALLFIKIDGLIFKMVPCDWYIVYFVEARLWFHQPFYLDCQFLWRVNHVILIASLHTICMVHAHILVPYFFSCLGCNNIER